MRVSMLVFFLLGSSFTPGVAAQTTYVVDGRGGGNFRTISSALSVAQPGDRIEVLGGPQPVGCYSGFALSIGIDIEGIEVLGRRPWVEPSRVSGVGAGQTARLSNLTFAGGDCTGTTIATPLRVTGCQGSVLLHRLKMAALSTFPPPRTTPGCHIEGCINVILSSVDCYANARSPAVNIVASSVLVRGGEFRGGVSSANIPGAGSAIRVTGSTIVVSGARLIGGGNTGVGGGAGAAISGSGSVLIMDRAEVAGGCAFTGCARAITVSACRVTPDCIVLGPTGSFTPIPRLPTLSTPDEAYLGTTVRARTLAPPGASAILLMSTNHDYFSLLPMFEVPLLLGLPMFTVGMGTSSGAPIDINVVLPYQPALKNAVFFFQAAVIGGGISQITNSTAIRVRSAW